MSSTPRRRRIAGESKPGEIKPGEIKPSDAAAPAARRPVPPRRPAPPAQTEPEPALELEDTTPATVEPETESDTAAAVVAPAAKVRRPTRPQRRVSQPADTPDPDDPVDVDADADADVEVVDEHDSAAEAEAASGPTPRSRGQLAAAVVAAVVGIAAAVGGYLHMTSSTPLSQSQARAAADAAAVAVEQVLSFDYRDLDAYEAGVDGLLTDGYVADELEPSLAALREQAPAAAAQVRTQVHAAATIACADECPSDRATVLVVIDKVTMTANLQAPTVTPQRLNVAMVRTDGRWLVDAITYIGA